ncbi:MAG: sigma 54-interacting transcriptional regulator, partial [Candidatus Binataceae bacterium]
MIITKTLAAFEDLVVADRNEEPDDGWIEVEGLGVGAENLGGMVVGSEGMRRVLKTIARLGPYKATVLVHGESGTGK